MGVIKNEFQKVIIFPVVSGLLVLFIGFNIFIIMNYSYMREELNLISNHANIINKMEKNELEIKTKIHFEKELAELNQMLNMKASEKYKSVYDIYHEGRQPLEEVYTQEEILQIEKVRVSEELYTYSDEIDAYYEQIDCLKKGEIEIKKYRLSGEAANTVRNEYEKFNQRFNELVLNNEHKALFFIGDKYEMHSLLFKTLFGWIIFELIILIILITTYIVNYEEDHGTVCSVYTTKRGRRILWDKLLVAIITNVLVFTVLISSTLIVYFSVFDYSAFIDTPISSFLNREYAMPYMAWWNLSFIQYLICGIAVIYSCVIIFSLMIFCLARIIKNSYYVVFIFGVIYGVFLYLPGLMPNSSNYIFISGFTPFMLMMNSRIWFMESGAFTTFQFYEINTVCSWSVLLIGLSAITIRRFKIKDI